MTDPTATTTDVAESLDSALLLIAAIAAVPDWTSITVRYEADTEFVVSVTRPALDAS